MAQPADRKEAPAEAGGCADPNCVLIWWVALASLAYVLVMLRLHDCIGEMRTLMYRVRDGSLCRCDCDGMAKSAGDCWASRQQLLRYCNISDDNAALLDELGHCSSYSVQCFADQLKCEERRIQLDVENEKLSYALQKARAMDTFGHLAELPNTEMCGADPETERLSRDLEATLDNYVRVLTLYVNAETRRLQKDADVEIYGTPGYVASGRV